MQLDKPGIEISAATRTFVIKMLYSTWIWGDILAFTY